MLRRVARASRLVARVRVTADLAVARVAVRLDGHLIYRRRLPPPHIEVTLPTRATRGHHTVAVTAADVAHNTGRATRALNGH
jgi:hypothetical protein